MTTRLAHPRVHGGNPWQLVRQQGGLYQDIVDFSVDVNPRGFPASVRTAILAHLEDLRTYPDPEALELREAIAAHHGVMPEVVLPGNGAAELIMLLARLPNVHRAVIITPTFGEYAWAVEQAGGTALHLPTDEAEGFKLRLDTFDWNQHLDSNTLVFLCNPNNPTGVLVPREVTDDLASRCSEAGARLVVDESFIELLEDPARASVVAEAGSSEHVIVLRSLTKCFGIPGLRLGYLIGSPSLVDALRELQPAWPLNTFALSVGVRLFQETAFLAKFRRDITALREAFAQELRNLLGLRPLPSVTNFILCKLTRAELTAEWLCEQMAHCGLLIRNCDSFPGLAPGRFIRIAVRSQEDNHRLLCALREVITNGR